MAALGWLLNLGFAAGPTDAPPEPPVATVPGGGGSYRRYRYLPVSQDFTEKKRRITVDEEDELKRLLLESEETHAKQVEILEARSRNLIKSGIELSQVRSQIESLKSELEKSINASIDFDIKQKIKALEIKRDKIIMVLLLMSAV